MVDLLYLEQVWVDLLYLEKVWVNLLYLEKSWVDLVYLEKVWVDLLYLEKSWVDLLYLEKAAANSRLSALSRYLVSGISLLVDISHKHHSRAALSRTELEQKHIKILQIQLFPVRELFLKRIETSSTGLVVTHKGWDCPKLTLSVSIFRIPCSCKFICFFVQSIKRW